MQLTSGNYDAYADVRVIQPQVVFELIDVDAAEVATAAASEGAAISNLAQSYDSVTTMTQKLATLEPDYWALDGSYGLYDGGNPGEVGYWSEAMSDNAGAIAVTVTYTFGSAQDSDGFTVVADDRTGECCDSFTITTYAGTTQLTQAVVTGNTDPVRLVTLPTQGYDKVVLSFTKTANPFRRVRLCECVFGYLQYFRADDISQMNLDRATAKDMKSLPSSSLELTIDNSDGRYNINNPSGIYAYLQKGQGLTASVLIGGEPVQVGRYYFEGAESADNNLTAKITAYDRFYAMDTTVCNIGVTGTWAVTAAVAAVIADSGLDIETVIPSEIGGREINKCIPQGTSHREALRLIAQAARAVCFFNPLDKLVFLEPSAENPVTEYTSGKIMEWPAVKDTGLINKVTIKAKDEYANTETEYTASSMATGDIEKPWNVTNPLVRETATADWLLAMSQLRTEATVKERGDPALELCDPVTLIDKFGNTPTGFVQEQNLTIEQGAACTTKVVMA